MREDVSVHLFGYWDGMKRSLHFDSCSIAGQSVGDELFLSHTVSVSSPSNQRIVYRSYQNARCLQYPNLFQ